MSDMRVATPQPGRSVMTNYCRNCGEMIERWSGPNQRWAHGQINDTYFECDEDGLEAFQEEKRAQRKRAMAGGSA